MHFESHCDFFMVLFEVRFFAWHVAFEVGANAFVENFTFFGVLTSKRAADQFSKVPCIITPFVCRWYESISTSLHWTIEPNANQKQPKRCKLTNLLHEPKKNFNVIQSILCISRKKEIFCGFKLEHFFFSLRMNEFGYGNIYWKRSLFSFLYT